MRFGLTGSCWLSSSSVAIHSALHRGSQAPLSRTIPPYEVADAVHVGAPWWFVGMGTAIGGASCEILPVTHHPQRKRVGPHRG